MIVLLDDGTYFYDDKTDIRDFLISYASYIGLDMRIFRILAKSGEMSTSELVEYINKVCHTYENISEIYEVGKKVY